MSDKDLITTWPNLAKRWVLVAGTGRRSGLPSSICILAEELGRSLAQHQYGLVLGGWPGVDHIAARSFAATLQRGQALSDHLVQVVTPHRPARYPDGAKYPDFEYGYRSTAPTGAHARLQAPKFSDAVILLGGEGATLETFHHAVQGAGAASYVPCPDHRRQCGSGISRMHREVGHDAVRRHP